MSGRELPLALRLERLDERRFRAGGQGEPGGRDVVFGGLLIAQMILAGATATAKDVARVSTAFARPAAASQPVEIEVEPMHEGSVIAHATVTVRQEERLCARALMVSEAAEADLISHEPAMPEVAPPEEVPATEPSLLVGEGTEVRVVGGVDLSDPDAPTGPPELHMWVRLPDAGGGEPTNRALLAYATVGFLIGAAMRPHAGVGLQMAHRSVSTGVISHALSFHRAISPGQWLLAAHQAVYAGGGRVHGRGGIWSREGSLLTSFSQDAIVREGRPGARM